MSRLDPDELEVLEAFEAGSLAPVADKAELRRLREAARATPLKDGRTVSAMERLPDKPGVPVHWRMTQVSITHLRQLIRTLCYVVSTHAADELEDDHLAILDLENIILSGDIIEHHRDRHTRETKYVIQGRMLEGIAAEVVAKVGHTGRLFIITVYVL